MIPAPGQIVHVSTPRSWRGGEQQLVYLAERLQVMGVPQLVVCPPGSELEHACAERGFPCTTLRRRASVDPFFARAIARLSNAAGAVLVHAHDPHAHTAAVLGASLFGLAAPVIVHRRVDFPVRRSAFSRWKYDHPAVRRIICVSRAVAEIVRPALREPSRLRVVHDGVDPARFEGARSDGRLRRQYGIPEGVPLVGNVAALAGHKDYFTFVDTAARLLSDGLEAWFVAIGDGPLRDDIAAHVRAKGLERRVILAGFRADVPSILPELNVFLFTSKEEGLGSSILDAHVCGVPVVATAAGGVPEIVVDGETGLLAPVGDAAALAACVRRLLEDAALRERLVRNAAGRLDEFRVDRMAERTLAIYGEAVEESRR